MRIFELKFFVGLLAVLCASLAYADPAPVKSKIVAHPALWVVHGNGATAYLLGSVHVLPPNVEWRSAELDAAFARSDTFVFEAPLDEAGQAAGQQFIRDHGTLPPDTSLPSLINPQTLKDYRKALALTHVAPESLDQVRPWLAAIILEVALVRAENYSPDSGVDRQIYSIAKSEGKSVQCFETVDQQLSMLMPQDPKLELSEFDTNLKELQTESNEIGPLVDAWSHGNVAEVAKLINTDIESDPETRKVLLDDRNRNWVSRLKTMLAQPHTYFITVGAGHLVGPHGVPALLRKAGYTVDGP